MIWPKQRPCVEIVNSKVFGSHIIGRFQRPDIPTGYTPPPDRNAERQSQQQGRLQSCAKRHHRPYSQAFFGLSEQVTGTTILVHLGLRAWSCPLPYVQIRLFQLSCFVSYGGTGVKIAPCNDWTGTQAAIYRQIWVNLGRMGNSGMVSAPKLPCCYAMPLKYCSFQML